MQDLRVDGRLVAGGWGWTLLAAATLTALVLAGWEGFWRGRGAVPSISSVDASWSVARNDLGAEGVALIGTSKMQSGLDPRVLDSEIGRPSAQLARINASPLPILEHLAADPEFRGTVVMDVAPRIFFDGTAAGETAARSVLAAYRRFLSSPGERINALLAMRVENALVLRRPGFSLRRLLDWWRNGSKLEVPVGRVRIDRYRELERAQIDNPSRRTLQAANMTLVGKPATAAELDQMIERVGRAAAALRARGGQVVLTMLPVSGRARRDELRRFPEEAYWDSLVDRTGLPAIHFDDYPELRRFDVADGVHLDREEAEDFTIAFSPHLASVLPAPGD